MADTLGLEPSAVRHGGSSPPFRMFTAGRSGPRSSAPSALVGHSPLVAVLVCFFLTLTVTSLRWVRLF